MRDLNAFSLDGRVAFVPGGGGSIGTAATRSAVPWSPASRSCATTVARCWCPRAARSAAQPRDPQIGAGRNAALPKQWS